MSYGDNRIRLCVETAYTLVCLFGFQVNSLVIVFANGSKYLVGYKKMTVYYWMLSVTKGQSLMSVCLQTFETLWI